MALDTTVITRAKPAHGRPLAMAETRDVMIGPRANTRATIPGHRGYATFGGIYRTPLSPRQYPKVEDDFHAGRASIEHLHCSLHQYWG